MYIYTTLPLVALLAAAFADMRGKNLAGMIAYAALAFLAVGVIQTLVQSGTMGHDAALPRHPRLFPFGGALILGVLWAIHAGFGRKGSLLAPKTAKVAFWVFTIGLVAPALVMVYVSGKNLALAVTLARAILMLMVPALLLLIILPVVGAYTAGRKTD